MPRAAGSESPQPAEEAAERKSRIGALKQQLSQSDSDMARLEHHIRGLLVRSQAPPPGGGKRQRPRGALDASTDPLALLGAGWPGSSPSAVASAAGAPRLPGVALGTAHGSPWAVLQVPDDEDELRRQLEGAWRENEHLKARELADRLTIEDLRQKLGGVSRHEMLDSEIQAQLRLAKDESAEKDRMIRVLEIEVDRLTKVSQDRGREPDKEAALRLAQIGLLENQNQALENEVGVLSRQLAAVGNPDKDGFELREERAKLHVARLSLESRLQESASRVSELESQKAALQQSDTESRQAASDLSAQNKALLQQVAELQGREALRSKEAAAEIRAVLRQVAELQAELKGHEISRSKDSTELIAENCSLHQQMRELQAQLKEFEAAKTRHERQDTAQRDQIVAQKTQIEACRLELEDLRSKLVQSKQAYKLLSLEYSNLQNADADRARDQVAQKERSAREARAALMPTVTLLVIEIAGAIDLMRDVAVKSLMDKSRQEEREDFLADAFTLLQQKERDLESSKEGTSRKAEETRSRAEEEVASARRARAEVQKELDGATSKMRDLKVKLDSALAQVDDLQADKRASRQTARELEKAERDKSKLEKELGTSKISLGAFKRELAALRETHSQRLAVITGESTSLQAEITELKGTLKAERDKSAALDVERKALEDAHQLRIDALRGEVSTLKGEVSSLQASESQRVAALKSEVGSLRGEISGLQGKLAKSENDKGTASAEMAALRDENTGLKGEIHGLQEELTKHHAGTDSRLGRLEARMPFHVHGGGRAQKAVAEGGGSGGQDSGQGSVEEVDRSLKFRSEVKGAFLLRLDEIESKYFDQINSLETQTAMQSADIHRLNEANGLLQRDLSAARQRLEQQQQDLDTRMPRLQDQISKLESSVDVAGRDAARDREALTVATERVAELQQQNEILKITLESAEISAAAAGEDVRRQSETIEQLHAQAGTMQKAFRHLDDLGEGLRSRVRGMFLESSLLLRNHTLLNVTLGEKGCRSLQSTVRAIERQLEAQSTAYLKMRQLYGIAETSRSPSASANVLSPEREREDAARDIAVAGIAAVAAPGFMSPRRVDDAVVLLLKLLILEGAPYESRDHFTKALQCDIAEALAVEPSRLLVECAAPGNHVVQLSIVPSSVPGSLDHTPAALATLLAAQTRIEGSLIRRGAVSGSIVSVWLMSDFTEMIRSLSMTIRLRDYGVTDRIEEEEAGEGQCSLDEIFRQTSAQSDQRDKAVQNNLLPAGDSSERNAFEGRMGKLLDVAQTLLGRLNLIQGLPRIGRVVYSVRSKREGDDASILSRASSRDSSRSLSVSARSLSSSAVCSSGPSKRTILVRTSPHFRTPSAAGDTCSTPKNGSTSRRVNLLHENLSALRLQCNRVRAAQAAQQRKAEELQRATSSRAIKIMLIQASITKLARQRPGPTQEPAHVKLTIEKKEQEEQQEVDLRSLADLHNSLEGLQQEFHHTEAAIARVMQHFRASSSHIAHEFESPQQPRRLSQSDMYSTIEPSESGGGEDLFDAGPAGGTSAVRHDEVERDGRPGIVGSTRPADMAGPRNARDFLNQYADSPSVPAPVSVKSKYARW